MYTETGRLAFERLLRVAKTDTGQGKVCATFVLSWWNAHVYGGFSVEDIHNLDQVLKDAVKEVISAIADGMTPLYPQQYDPDVQAIIKLWHPNIDKPKRKPRRRLAMKKCCCDRHAPAGGAMFA